MVHTLGNDEVHFANGLGRVGYRAFAVRAGDGKRMSVEIDRRESVEAQYAARGPVRIRVERDVPLDVGHIGFIVKIREVRRRGRHLCKKFLRHLVVHIPHAALAHWNQVHHDLSALCELRGVDAGVACVAGRALVVEGEKIDAVCRAGRPGVRDRQIEGIAAANLFDPPVAAVEMVEEDVVDGVGRI